MCQTEPRKDVSEWVTCPGVKGGLELLLSIRQNVGRKEMLENSLASSMSLTSRQLDATSAIPCLQVPSGTSKSPLVEPPRIRALRVVPPVDPLDVATLYQILELIWTYRPGLSPLDMPMAGELLNDLSVDLVKDLAEETNGISGLSVAKAEVGLGTEELAEDGTEGDVSPDSEEGLTLAACKGEDSVSLESIKTEEHKPTWKWLHRPIKIPKPI